MGCPGLKDSCPILTLRNLLTPWGLHGALLPWYHVQAGSAPIACDMSHSCLTVCFLPASS